MEDGRQAVVEDVVSVESEDEDAAVELEEAVEVLSAEETAADGVVITNILVELSVEFKVKAELVVELDVTVELMSVLDVVITEFIIEFSTLGGCVKETDVVVGNSVIIYDAVLEGFRAEPDIVTRGPVVEENATEPLVP